MFKSLQALQIDRFPITLCNNILPQGVILFAPNFLFIDIYDPHYKTMGEFLATFNFLLNLL